MKMNCNLKKLASFFKFFPYILEKSLKLILCFFPTRETFYHFLSVLRAISGYKTSSLSNIRDVLTKI